MSDNINSLKCECKTEVENLRTYIREYIFLNPGCRKNDVAHELGLYSGYRNTRTNYLSWALIMNDQYILVTKGQFKVKETYQSKKYTIDDLYKNCQLSLIKILENIVKLLQIQPGLGNSEIAKNLEIESYVLDNDGEEGQRNWFSWSCLSILYDAKIIEAYDKYGNKINPYKKKKGETIDSYKIKLGATISLIKSQNRLDPKSNDSFGIQIICDILKELNIGYGKEYKIKKCRDKLPLPFDISINKNTLIEFDGGHHFYNVYGEASHNMTREHDQIKDNYCQENKIYLLRISYDQMSKDKMKKHITDFLEIANSGDSTEYVIKRGNAYALTTQD